MWGGAFENVFVRFTQSPKPDFVATIYYIYKLA